MMKETFLIHAHVFYPELWDELARCIGNFPSEARTIVVTVSAADTQLEARIKNDFPDARIDLVENRGYDVGPFIDLLGRIDLSAYTYIVKLHTKRDWSGWFNSSYTCGSRWREQLLNFCASKKNFDRVLGIFRSRPEAGVVVDSSVIVTRGDFLEKESVKAEAEALLEDCGLTPAARAFVGGTMFIIRSELLRPLAGRHTLQDFAPVRHHEVATLAHIYERALGYLVTAQGFEITGFNHDPSLLRRLWFIIIPTYRVLAFLRRLI